jgi:hypothetical protein
MAGTAQAQLQGSAPISAATQEAVYLRKLGASQAHLRMKDTSIDAAAQYIVHSDLGRVQARVPWAKPSILHGQVTALPAALVCLSLCECAGQISNAAHRRPRAGHEAARFQVDA